MRVVIIGGNHAGMAVAMHLRRNDDKCEIIILEASDELGVSVQGLPYLAEGKLKNPDALVGATPLQLKKLFHIETRLQVNIKHIFAAKKYILLDNEERLAYDKLILANWCLGKPQHLKGIEQPYIFDAGCLKDMARLADFEVNKVLISGGGFYSLRLAEAFIKRGAEVTLVTPDKHLLPSFDEDFAEMVTHKIKLNHLKIHVRTTIKKFLPQSADLSNGQIENFDVALLVPPEVSVFHLPMTPMLKFGPAGGVAVDKWMHTSVNNVWACGDIIEYRDILSKKTRRLNSAALIAQSAKCVADVTTRRRVTFHPVLQNQIVKVFGYYIGQIGCSEADLRAAGLSYHRVYLSQPHAEVYLKEATPLNAKLLFGHNGMLLGLQLFGKNGVSDRLNTAAALMSQQASVYQLARLPLAYFPELSLAKDMLNNLGSLSASVLDNKLKTLRLSSLKEDDVILNVCNKTSIRLFTKAQMVHLPFQFLRENLHLLPTDKRIVVYCGSGYSAYLAYCLLRNNGFEKAYLLNSPEVWQ